jgi:hypothetical protein
MTPAAQLDLDPGGQAVRNTSWTVAAVVTLLAALVPAVIWPGDTPWMNDEPAQIAKAFHANQARTLEYRGLKGSLGIHYGPLPTQIYQLLLLLTHDPIKLVVLRAALCSGVTALALLWLSRTLRLNPWFAACVVLAPFVWLWTRVLWDASFAIPIGSMALAAYASFLQTKSRWPLLLALLCALALPVIHFQDLPLAAVILGHMFWRHRPELRRHWVGVAAVIALMLALNAAYAGSVLVHLATHFNQVVGGGHPEKANPLWSMWHPLLGGKLLAGYKFAGAVTALTGPRALVATAKVLSLLPVPLVCAGAALLTWREIRRWRGMRPVPGPRGDTPPVRDSVFRMALAALGLQMLLFGAMRVPAVEQYFFGTYPVHVLLAWVAVEALARFRMRGAVIALYGFSLVVITLGSIWQVHRTGWNFGSMVPKLKDQVAVARELNRYSDASAMNDVALYQQYPKALYTLRLLLPPQPGQPRRHSGRLVIRYRKDPDDRGGRGGTIELIEAASEADVPPDATRMPLTGSSE